MPLRFLAQNGGVCPSRLPLLLLFLARNALSASGRLMEWLYLGPRVRVTQTPEDPVFILGHYRSGTTLVHKLMAADPRFGSVSTFDLLFPHCPVALKRLVQTMTQRMINALGIKQGFFHDYGLRLDDPNETEPLMLSCGSPMSSYWGYVFPRKATWYLNRYVDFQDARVRQDWMEAYAYFLSRVTRRAGGMRLVVKDPPNMGRLHPLLEMYPNARFLCVYRNPYQVFLSMRTLWRDTIERRFSLQAIGAGQRDAIILSHYQTLMEAYHRDRNAIPEGALVEVPYESLLLDPLGRLRQAYRALKLPDFDEAKIPMKARLEQDQGYLAARYPSEPDLTTEIREVLDDWGSRLGYRS